MTETQQTQQKEAILALPVREAIKQFGMEGAVTILENRGYDQSEVVEYVSRGFPFQKIGKPGEATALSVSDDLKSMARWKIYYSGAKQPNTPQINIYLQQIKEIRALKTEYKHGDKQPLLAKLREERDQHLNKITDSEEYLPLKNNHEKEFLFTNSDGWATQSLDQKTKAIFAAYFLDHVAAYLTIDRAIKKEQPVVKS